MNTSLPSLAFLLAAACLHPAAHGSDEVTDAMQAAYAPYRAALFRTNSNAQAEAEQAMAGTRKAWGEILARYGSAPPAPYQRDPDFRASLAKVDEVFARSQELVLAGKLAQAHAVLEEARDLLSELRARNGVITFSDHMNDYHAEMEAVLTKGPALLDQPAGIPALTERAGVLGYLASRLRQNAPATLAGDAEFTALQSGLELSVDALRTALLRQDPAAARTAIDGLKAPYSRMFLKFG